MKKLKFPVKYGYFWQHNLPTQWKTENQYQLQSKLILSNTTEICNRKIMLKLDLVGRHMTGVLGLEFVANISNELVISVGVTENPKQYGAMFVGLQENFAKSILNSILSCFVDIPFSGGSLKITHSVWHPVDSSEMIFRILSRSLVYILGENHLIYERELVDQKIMEAL